MQALYSNLFPVHAGNTVKMYVFEAQPRRSIKSTDNGILRVLGRSGNFYVVEAELFERLMQRLEDYEGDLSKIMNDA